MISLCIAYKTNYPVVRAHHRQHETSPTTLTRSTNCPRSHGSTRDINNAIDENRAIDANNCDEQHQRSKANVATIETNVKAYEQSHRAINGQDRATQPTSTTTKSMISSNDTIKRRCASTRPEQNTSLAIKKTRPTKGVTYEQKRHGEGARRQMQQVRGCREAEIKGKMDVHFRGWNSQARRMENEPFIVECNEMKGRGNTTTKPI